MTPGIPTNQSGPFPSPITGLRSDQITIAPSPLQSVLPGTILDRVENIFNASTALAALPGQDAFLQISPTHPLPNGGPVTIRGVVTLNNSAGWISGYYTIFSVHDVTDFSAPSAANQVIGVRTPNISAGQWTIAFEREIFLVGQRIYKCVYYSSNAALGSRLQNGTGVATNGDWDPGFIECILR